MTLVQAIGGAIAVSVGIHLTSSFGDFSSRMASFGLISDDDSIFVVNNSKFENCTAETSTDRSLGTFSVFGGAFAIIQSPEVSSFRLGVMFASEKPRMAGSNLTVQILKSFFFNCSAMSNASIGSLSETNGAGGAIYASSFALTNFTVTESTFHRNRVSVASAATGLFSFSSGGALAVEAGPANSSFLAVSSCIFHECTVQGANISNMMVRGGALHAIRAARISVIQTNFSNCSIIDVFNSDIVSGGASMSAIITGSLSVLNCFFDASGGQDSSATSTGLLMLARNSSDSHAYVSGCTFISSMIVLSFRCVGNGDRRRVTPCVGPEIVLRASRIQQISSPTDLGFNITGSYLMTLQNPKSISFTGSSMHCARAEFAVFKDVPAASLTISEAYSCRPCLPNAISLTATAVSLEQLLNTRNVDRCFPASIRTGCPFAVSHCTTFVGVSSGFWTNISDSRKLEEARRCPRGYCGCTNPTDGVCALPPPLSINRNRDPLCNGNRTGKLCGGCPPNFTQSLDDRTCVSNEQCSKALWWVWMLSMLGFAAYSLYIVVSCRKLSHGAFSCLFFYFQMSSFATANSGETNDAISRIFEYFQARSVAALYVSACYAPSLSAYNATALKLIGPLFVLMFAIAWTWIIHKLQARLQQRNIDINVSYSGSIAVTILFVFSNVANIVFSLVECTSYSDPDAVVFIDGTVPCKDAKWTVLLCVAVLLFLFPAAFIAALRLKTFGFGQRSRDAVCGKYTESMFYWGGVSLSFRLFISVTQFLNVDYPNLMAVTRSFLSIGVLVLLVHLRPYLHNFAFWVDVSCYASLAAQFSLQIIDTTRQFLGVAVLDKETFFADVSTWSTVFR